jgi:PEP-CTERM motif-containing protein
VAGEWLVWKIPGQGAFDILVDAIPVLPTLAFRSATQVSYSEVTPEPTLNAGLPDSFTFNATNISGTETQFNPKTGATIFYDSNYPVAGSGLIGWDFGAGRVISFSTLIAEEELADANYAQLFSNAISWSAGVVIPEPSSTTLLCIGAGLSIAAGAVRRRRDQV